MNKAELIKAISKNAGTTKADAEQSSTDKHRRRPEGAAKTHPAGAAAPADHSTAPDIDVVEGKFSLKDQLTQKELRFIELYLLGEHSVDKAMELAGYEGYHPHSLYRLGRKIVQKYEQSGGDARKILRSVGVGEVQVAKKILELMNDSSKNVQLRATELAAKCLGMTKENVEIAQGIQIVIKTPDGKIVQPTPAGQAIGESRATQPKSASLPAMGPQVRMIK